MKTVKQQARISGLVYLMVIVFGITAQVIRSSFIIQGSVYDTAQNIISSPFIFRLNFVMDLIMMLSFLFLPLALYRFLNNIDTNYATIMVIFGLVSIPMNMMNLLNYFAVGHILNSATYLSVINTEQLYAQAYFYYDLYTNGYHIAQIFFGLWLLPLGLLVLKSNYFPKFWGYLLIASCFGHLIELLILFLKPELQLLTYPGLIIATIGELGFCLWLIFRGAKE